MAKVIKVGKGATQYKVVIAKNALTKVNLLTPLKTNWFWGPQKIYWWSKANTQK